MIYFVQSMETGHVKIGYSKNPEKRHAQLQTGTPSTLQMLGTIAGAQGDERVLHDMLQEYRVRGEWFQLTDGVREFIDLLIAEDKFFQVARVGQTGFLYRGPYVERYTVVAPYDPEVAYFRD